MKIDKGVAIVKHNRYPYDQMEVGDSVFFADKGDAEKMCVAGRSFAKYHDNGMAFSYRFVEDENGYRVWRTQ